MNKLIHRERKKRRVISKHHYFRYILKNIINNKNLNFTLRFNAVFKLLHLPKDSAKVQCGNRCVLTGRKSGIIKQFKLSRISLLKLSRFGQISGIKKSVW